MKGLKDFRVLVIPPDGDGLWLAYSMRYAERWLRFRSGMIAVSIAAKDMPTAKRRALSMARDGLLPRKCDHVVPDSWKYSERPR